MERNVFQLLNKILLSWKKILLLLFISICTWHVYGQNLDKMEKAKRETILLKKAKEIVMKHAPDYYREFKAPVIMHRYIGANEDRDLSFEEEQKNPKRSFYTVEYPYDDMDESFRNPYSVRVYIWGDSGKPFKLILGNGSGLCNLDTHWKGRDKIVAVYKKQPPRKKKE